LFVYDMRTGHRPRCPLGARAASPLAWEGAAPARRAAYVEKFRDESHVIIHAATLEYCVGRPHRPRRLLRRRRLRHPSRSSTSWTAPMDRLRQGPRPEERRSPGIPAVREERSKPDRRTLVRHHRRGTTTWTAAIRELVESIAKATSSSRGTWPPWSGTPHRSRHGGRLHDRGVTGQPLPHRFGKRSVRPTPPVTRLSFDPARSHPAGSPTSSR